MSSKDGRWFDAYRAENGFHFRCSKCGPHTPRVIESEDFKAWAAQSN